MSEWRSIPGYEGLYEVSECGRVRSIRREGTNGRELKPLANRGGYLKVVLCKRDIKKNLLIHQLVAKAFVENPLSYSVVDHIDSNRRNNSSANLEWVTSAENQRRAMAKRRSNIANPELVRYAREYGLTLFA